MKHSSSITSVLCHLLLFIAFVTTSVSGKERSLMSQPIGFYQKQEEQNNNEIQNSNNRNINSYNRQLRGTSSSTNNNNNNNKKKKNKSSGLNHHNGSPHYIQQKQEKSHTINGVMTGREVLSSFSSRRILDNNADCPIPAQGFACTRQYVPINCDGCEYSNSCQAKAAGYNITSDDCSYLRNDGEAFATMTKPKEASKGPPRAQNNDVPSSSDSSDNNNSCPIPKQSVVCTAKDAPVDCLDDTINVGSCTYPNICKAEAAGYVMGDCKSSTKNSSPGGNGDAVVMTGTKSEEEDNNKNGFVVCPPPRGNIACTRQYDPVDCVDDDDASVPCEYANLCVAEDAGYSLNKCNTKYIDGMKDVVAMKEGKITITTSTTNEEEKTLTIVVESSAATVIDDDEDEDDDEECPHPQDGLPCYYIMSPVDCDGCIYDNDCVAEGAGYNATTQCIPYSTNNERQYDIMNGNSKNNNN